MNLSQLHASRPTLQVMIAHVPVGGGLNGTPVRIFLAASITGGAFDGATLAMPGDVSPASVAVHLPMGGACSGAVAGAGRASDV